MELKLGADLNEIGLSRYKWYFISNSLLFYLFNLYVGHGTFWLFFVDVFSLAFLLVSRLQMQFLFDCHFC